MITVIPAIDLLEGKCVRLTKGDYGTQKIYNPDPVEVARSIEDAGLRHLHLVDLDGARSSHVVNHQILEKMASATSLIIDFGGGIKSEEDINIAFQSGAAQVNCGSIAIDKPSDFIEWIKNHGSDKMILSADTRDGFISTHGWSQDSENRIEPFVRKYASAGLKYLTSTDINSDGMLTSPNFRLYKELRAAFPDLIITASGGISETEQIKQLDKERIDRVIVGKAIYEGRITLEALQNLSEDVD